jgi:hypothetical protein
MGVSCGKQSEGKYSIRDRLFGGLGTSVCGESGRYTFAMIGLEQMRELAANAVEASFLPPERKLELTRRVVIS